MDAKLVRFTVRSGSMWDHYNHSSSFYTDDTTHEGIIERIQQECVFCDNPKLQYYEVVERRWQ
jgi:hypothetical protein